MSQTRNRKHARILFSPSQTILAYVSGQDIVFYNYVTKEDFLIQSHEQVVEDIAFSLSNLYFASLGEDMQIIVQNLITKQKIVSEVNLQDNGNKQNRLLFINLDTLLTFSQQGIVKVWKIVNSSSLSLQSIKELGIIKDIAYQQVTNRLLIAKYKQFLVYNLNEFYNTEFFKNTGQQIAVSTSSHQIAQNLNSKIRIIQVIGKQILFDLDNQAESKALSFSTNDKLLGNYGNDQQLKIWNLKSKIIVLKIFLYENINQIYFYEENEQIVCQGKNVNIFHIRNLEAIELDEVFFQQRIIFNAQLNNVVGFHQDKDMGSSVLIMKNWIRNENQRFKLDIPNDSFRISYSKSKFMAVLGSENLTVWQLSNENQWKEFSGILCYEFDQNEKLLLVRERNINLLDLENDNVDISQGFTHKSNFLINKFIVKFLTGNILVLAFSVDFRLFSIQDKQLNLIKTICVKMIEFKIVATPMIQCFWLKLQNGKFINLNNLEQKNYLKNDDISYINSMDVSFNQKLVALSSESKLCIWDLETLNIKVQIKIKEGKRCQGVVFLESSQFIFSEGENLYSVDIQSDKKEIMTAENVKTVQINLLF